LTDFIGAGFCTRHSHHGNPACARVSRASEKPTFFCYGFFMAGRWDIRLSPDGRLTLRKHFTSWNDRVFLTKHVNEADDRYLLGFSPRVWPRFTAEIRGQKGEAFYLEAAHELKIRSGGRIIIPQPLRDFAGLERDVTLVEMRCLDEFWLWDPKAYEAARDREEKLLFGPLDAFWQN
jgi:DNA-binding transcriptional regulator/RsmH inhibitor MraZ